MSDLLGEMRTAAADPTVPERVRVMLVDAVAEIVRLNGDVSGLRDILGAATRGPFFTDIRSELNSF